MPNYGYHLARAKGAWFRQLYRARMGAIVRRPIPVTATVPFEVFSYSGENMLPEQVASIRSLLRFAGRPKQFTVVSDGTHSERSLELLRRLDSCVRVSSASDWQPTNIPADARSYLATHPTGKQLALIMSLPQDGAALYVDSDVLFFPAARSLSSLPCQSKDPALYLVDCRLSADERLYRREDEKKNPVNTGVLFLTRKIDWSKSIARLLELEAPPNFFTNQTMTHLAMTAAGAAPLDPVKFVLQLDDQFQFPDRYAGSGLVLRHYVNPVRHKFWSTLASGRSFS
ncbi:MAG TPA: hypothetical protein VLO30_07620 [Chthoniobacterales bacterium]|nr:hypothetical protein [Chthoniobacterales bacterium]